MIVWEGVYRNFKETGISTHGFVGDIWYKKQVDKIKSYIADSQQVINALTISKDYPLEVLASLLLAQQQAVKVLDFGGGMGEYYFKTCAKIPDGKSQVHFDVVESKKTLEHLPEEIKRFSNLRFFESLPSTENYHVVHFGSVMQYVESWQELIRKISSATSAEYLVFSDLLCGEIPTFVTKQKYYEQSIPVNWYNYSDFVSYVESIGFSLCYKSHFEVEILGSKTLAELSNLPEDHKLHLSRNLIFKRIS
jgi:putative methyltransferase (TIGR04325 family)